jgi:anti-sigma factor ChrR (cupin superfamily)
MKDCKKAEVVIQDNCETLAALGGKIKLTCEVGHIKASDGKSEINYRYQCH